MDDRVSAAVKGISRGRCGPHQGRRNACKICFHEAQGLMYRGPNCLLLQAHP